MYDISQVCLFTTNGNFSSALLQIDRARWTLAFCCSRWHHSCCCWCYPFCYWYNCLVLLLSEIMVWLSRFDESAAGAITGHQDRLEGLRGREGTGWDDCAIYNLLQPNTNYKYTTWRLGRERRHRLRWLLYTARDDHAKYKYTYKVVLLNQNT